MNASPKPKRPLTAYNLFYRYKRNRILEVTGGPASSNEERIDIHRVFAAPTGLEGVPLDHSIWTLPTEALDKIRAGNIKAAMEGKLSPNKNASSRLHRKVHGIGFVEMGRVMREMWARLDKVTKDVFHELAEVGRARYRILMEEHDKRMNRGKVDVGLMPAGAPADSMSHRHVIASAGRSPTGRGSATGATEAVPLKPAIAVSDKAAATIQAVPAMMEPMSTNEEKPIVSGSLASLPFVPHSNMEMSPNGPMGCSFQTKKTPMVFARRVSNCSQSANDNQTSLSPLSNSNTSSPLSSGPCSLANAYHDANARLLRDTNARLLRMLNNVSLPPPPLRAGFSLDAGPTAQSLSAGENSHPKLLSSGDSGAVASTLAPGSNGDEGPSTQDFRDLMETLDEARDDHHRETEVEAWARGPSYVFGRPMHDVKPNVE